MGAGNSIIRDRQGNAFETFYISSYGHNDEINEDTGEPFCDDNPCHCNDFFYEDVKGNIIHTYNAINKKVLIRELTYQDGWNNYYISLLETNILEIIITDNESDIAIGCIPIYNENGKYNSNIFKTAANKVMRMVANIYPDIRFRTGPWTSGTITDNEYYKYGT